MIAPELRRQLDILGYTDKTSKVRVRCFAPKGMSLDEQLKREMAFQKDGQTIPIPIEGWLYPNKGQGVFVRLKKKRSSGEVELDGNRNPIWFESKTYQHGITYLQGINAKGYGIYLIPNEGGGADSDISRFPALFYECDEISKDEQWQRLRLLEAELGRSASAIIETRKSLHCYFALTYDRVMASTWTQYQQRLIQEQDSDPSIWNPARVMRLASFNHQKWDTEQLKLEQFPVRLVQENDNKFILDEFDQILPEWDSSRWNEKQKHQRAEKGHQRSQQEADYQTPTAPTDNPWDIRNFAHYLDGYVVNGRQGWDTCKCPAHNGESNNSLHINQSTGAYTCHGGCDSKDVYHAALELAKSRGYQIPDKRTAHRFVDLGGWLFKLKQQLAKTVDRWKSWDIGRKGEVTLEDVSEDPIRLSDYQIGERLEAWKNLLTIEHPDPHSPTGQSVFKMILDSSAPGTGKSFDAGRVTPELFNAKRVIYVSNEHRNPSTPTLNSWPDLEARHNGLMRDEFGKLRRVKDGQPYVVRPNCGRHDTISALRNKNIPGADTAALVCQTCPNLEPCRAGAVFGYLNDRADTLSQPRLRAHPASLPDPAEYDYKDTVLLWEEASEILKAHRTIEVTEMEYIKTWALLTQIPQTFDALRPLLDTLYLYLSEQKKQPNKYGWKDTQIRELLPKPKIDDVNVAAIADALKPDLSFLNTTSEYGVDLADLPRQVRKNFSDSDATIAQQVASTLAVNWFPDFLNVLLGNVVGHLRIQYGTLTITLRDDRLKKITSAAQANIFLDATADPVDIICSLDIKYFIPDVRQAVSDTDNLEIVQVATMGRLGMSSRRKDENGNDTHLQKRIDALIAKIQQDTPGESAVVDFKRNTKDGDGKRRWWSDSRGVNDLEDYDALVLVGTPCRNVSDLEAEFTVLFGRSPEEGTERVKYPVQVNGQPSPDLQPYFEMEVSVDKEFREFCRRRILADIHQAIGRLRAHRRPEQQLKVYFIADYPLDIPVTLRKASDITPEAATKVERVELAIRGAVQQLKATGQKITQQAIAAMTKLLDPEGKGYSQQYISRFKVLLQTLLDDFNSKSSKNSGPPPASEEVEWMGLEYLPKLAEEPPAELLEGLLTAFESYGQEVFHQIWDAVPAAVQVKILTVLMFTLDAGELWSLFKAVGVRC